MNIQTIKNVSDCVPLYLPHSLYLKPYAKFNISVALPQSTITGKTISNLDVMEKLRQMILPEQFSVLKVNKKKILKQNIPNLKMVLMKRITCPFRYPKVHWNL